MYTPNNIEFRIVSANSIAQFKSNQAFDFNEVLHNDKCKFSSDSKELMLLNYDVWFSFILKLEKIFLNIKDLEPISQELINFLLLEVNETLLTIDNVASSHPELFNPKILKIINKTHKCYIDHTKETINKSTGISIHIAFANIVNSISESLHEMIFELQECEYLLNKTKKEKTAFINLTNVSHNSPFEFNQLVERTKIYNTAFGIKNFVVKNYTDLDISDLLNRINNEGYKAKELILD